MGKNLRFVRIRVMNTGNFPKGGKNIGKNLLQVSLNVEMNAKAINSAEIKLRPVKFNGFNLLYLGSLLADNNFYCQSNINRTKFKFVRLLLSSNVEEVFAPETLNSGTQKSGTTMERVLPVSKCININGIYYSHKIFHFIAQTSVKSIKQPSLYLLRDTKSNAVFATDERSVFPLDRQGSGSDAMRSYQFGNLEKWDLKSYQYDTVCIAA